MHNTLESPEPQRTGRKGSPITGVIAAIALIAVVLTLWFLLKPMLSSKTGPAGPATVNLQMTPAEQEYTKKIEVDNIAMSRAENFLHQEVTTINGDVFNGGSQPVSGLRLTVEFYDDMNQVVLRETRAILGTPEQPLLAGERRAFEISFEHVPSSWNMQKPIVRVSYLQLPPAK
jgi:hypothetical protein